MLHWYLCWCQSKRDLLMGDFIKTFNVNNINTTYGGTVLANVPLWYDRFKLNSKSEKYEKYIYDNEEYTDINLVLAAAGLDQMN